MSREKRDSRSGSGRSVARAGSGARIGKSAPASRGRSERSASPAKRSIARTGRSERPVGGTARRVIDRSRRRETTSEETPVKRSLSVRVRADRPEKPVGRIARPALRRSASSGEQSPKRLLLRGVRRPSRQELLRELGKEEEWKSNRRPGRRKDESFNKGDDSIRLNRFIANAGICSRREADTFIAAGVVTINGKFVTELGTKVMPDDEVRFDGRLITPERKVYLLLNKPKDFVTTTDDPHATHTVMELVKNACTERIYPVGRLDRNTTGLLLFTNDGEMAKKLSHPSAQVEKVYQVTLDKVVSVNDLQEIASGIELEEGLVAADAISFVEGQEKSIVGIQIHSGQNRVVRRIFEKLGYRVKALDRVSYAGLTKKNIPRGKWRMLNPQEVNYLKMR